MRPFLVLGTLAITVSPVGSLEAQAPPAGSGSTSASHFEALHHLGEQIDSALAGPDYSGLDALEKRVVAYLAINAVMIVDTGQCADPSAQGSAAESFLFTFAGIARKRLQPVFALPPARKTELLDKAMDLASQQTPDDKRTDSLCDGRLLPASSVKPIAERRQLARQVLSLGLSPPTSDKAARPPTSGEHSETPSSQPNSTQSPVPR